MDLCKLIFNILAAILVLVGLTITGLGFYGPTLHREKKLSDDGTEKLDTLLKGTFFVIAITGLVLVGLAGFGLISVNCGYKLLMIIFAIALIVIAVLLLILSGLAFGAVYLRTTVFKQFWGPKMRKYDPEKQFDQEFAQVQGLQAELPCCGLSDEDVYQKYAENLPFSCCGNNAFPDGLDPFKLGSEISNEFLKKLKKCTTATVKSLGRKGCDVAGTEGFILLGKILAWGCLVSALYLIAVVVMACCVKRRDL